MSSPFVAEVRIFPFNFAPKGWARCDGQLLPISQNTALFSLLGTMYGGDGKSTFALPNLNGSSAIGAGQGAGLSEYFQGETGGASEVSLLPSEMPLHTHEVTAVALVGNEDEPSAGRPAQSSIRSSLYAPSVNATTEAAMAVGAVTPTGGQPHNNMPPYLVLGFYIALQGVFPPR